MFEGPSGSESSSWKNWAVDEQCKLQALMQSTPSSALGVHLGPFKALPWYKVEETLDLKSKDPETAQDWQCLSHVTLLKSLFISDPCFLSVK